MSKKKIYHDERSYQKDGMWYVYPFKENGNRIEIICPYCGKIHTHGNAPGHRVSHCRSNDNPGYIIVIGGQHYGK